MCRTDALHAGVELRRQRAGDALQDHGHRPCGSDDCKHTHSNADMASTLTRQELFKQPRREVRSAAI